MYVGASNLGPAISIVKEKDFVEQEVSGRVISTHVLLELLKHFVQLIESFLSPACLEQGTLSRSRVGSTISSTLKEELLSEGWVEKVLPLWVGLPHFQ